MKYVIAVIACAAEWMLYAFLGVLLGWKNHGGYLPMMILLAVLVATWRAITKRGNAESAPLDTGAKPEQSERK